MKIVLTLALLFLASCASRVLVRDCRDAGTGYYNCAKVADLP